MSVWWDFRPWSDRLSVGLLALVCVSVVSAVVANPLSCDDAPCGLYSKEAYPNFVVGRVTAVATESQVQSLFQWSKQNGYWTGVPDDTRRFVGLVQVVSISIPGPGGEVDMSLLMSREEYDGSPINPGDFVRYTRHPGDEPMTSLFRDPDTRPYWELFGCVAVLCREDDKPCPARYASGVYRFEDGVPLHYLTNQPIAGGQSIDVETFLPR